MGDFSSPSFGALGEQTKEQIDARKEQGFMPHNPFASSSNLAPSNIAPTNAFQNNQNFGGGFDFPKAFHGDFGTFGSGGFGSSKETKEQPKEETSDSAPAVEHKPRGKSGSSYRPRYAQRRSDNFNHGDQGQFESPRLDASPSKKQEQKDKGKCEVVHKDGMTCEVSLQEY